MSMGSMLANTFLADQKDLKLILGLVTRMLAHWSSSTMLLGVFDLSNYSGNFLVCIDLVNRYLVAPLLSIVTFSGAAKI